MAWHTPWKYETDPSAFHFGAVVDVMGNAVCTPHGEHKSEHGRLLASAHDLYDALNPDLLDDLADDLERGVSASRRYEIVSDLREMAREARSAQSKGRD